MDDLSDERLRRIYMDHCAMLSSMQKIFRHNPEALEVEKLVLSASCELQKLLDPHMTPKESETLRDSIIYAQP